MVMRIKKVIMHWVGCFELIKMLIRLSNLAEMSAVFLVITGGDIMSCK